MGRVRRGGSIGGGCTAFRLCAFPPLLPPLLLLLPQEAYLLQLRRTRLRLRAKTEWERQRWALIRLIRGRMPSSVGGVGWRRIRQRRAIVRRRRILLLGSHPQPAHRLPTTKARVQTKTARVSSYPSSSSDCKAYTGTRTVLSPLRLYHPSPTQRARLLRCRDRVRGGRRISGLRVRRVGRTDGGRGRRMRLGG